MTRGFRDRPGAPGNRGRTESVQPVRFTGVRARSGRCFGHPVRVRWPFVLAVRDGVNVSWSVASALCGWCHGLRRNAHRNRSLANGFRPDARYGGRPPFVARGSTVRSHPGGNPPSLPHSWRSKDEHDDGVQRGVVYTWVVAFAASIPAVLRRTRSLRPFYGGTISRIQLRIPSDACAVPWRMTCARYRRRYGYASCSLPVLDGVRALLVVTGRPGRRGAENGAEGVEPEKAGVPLTCLVAM